MCELCGGGELYSVSVLSVSVARRRDVARIFRCCGFCTLWLLLSFLLCSCCGRRVLKRKEATQSRKSIGLRRLRGFYSIISWTTRRTILKVSAFSYFILLQCESKDQCLSSRTRVGGFARPLFCSFCLISRHFLHWLVKKKSCCSFCISIDFVFTTGM